MAIILCMDNVNFNPLPYKCKDTSNTLDKHGTILQCGKVDARLLYRQDNMTHNWTNDKDF